MIVVHDRDGDALRPEVLRFCYYPPRTGILQWFMAAALAGIVGISAVMILGACGVLSPVFAWRIATCPVHAAREPNTRLEAVLGRQASLEEQVAGLERQLARLGCLPFVQRDSAFLEPVEPNNQGGMNPGQWEEQDVRMLEGCWDLDSEYQIRDVESGEISDVASWSMCFDASGVGNQTFRFDNGTICQSGTTARFNSAGQLEISDDSDVSCSDRSYIYRQVAKCDLEPAGTASCEGISPETGDTTYYRIRER